MTSKLVKLFFVIVVMSIISIWKGWVNVLLINILLLLVGGIFLMLRARYHDYRADEESGITKIDRIVLGSIWALLCLGTLVIFIISLGESWEKALLINACLVLAWIVILGPSTVFQVALSYIKKVNGYQK